MSKDKRIKQLYEDIIFNSYIPQRFKNKSLSNYKPYPKNNEIYSKIKDFGKNYMDHKKNGDWLLMSGDYGLGKTHLAVGLIKEVAKTYARQYVNRRMEFPVSIIKKKENMRPILFKNITDLLQSIKKAYNYIDVDEDQVMWEFQTVPFLVIDDLGAERLSKQDRKSDGPSWKQEKLYTILDYRYRELKTTVITTNCTMGELIERVSQRVVERIQEATTTKLGLEGESYRIGGHASGV